MVLREETYDFQNDQVMVDYIITQLQIHMPQLQLQQQPGELFLFAAQQSKEEDSESPFSSLEINLKNVVEEMKAQQSTDVCDQFIHLLREQHTHIKHFQRLNIKETNVFPVIRNRECLEQLQDGDGLLNVPNVQWIGDLHLLFVEDRDIALVYLTEGMLKDFQTIDYRDVSDAQKLAEANLRRRGWHREAQKVNFPIGKWTYLFESKIPHQGQFFVREWVEEYIGRRFYLTFPTYYNTVVQTTSTQHALNNVQSDELHLALLRDFTSELYNHSHKPLSKKIFLYEHGEYRVI
jgi:hypothetical protein